MKIVLVSKCFLDIEQNVEFKISVLISPSKSLISSRWVTYGSCGHGKPGKSMEFFKKFRRSTNPVFSSQRILFSRIMVIRWPGL